MASIVNSMRTTSSLEKAIPHRPFTISYVDHEIDKSAPPEDEDQNNDQTSKRPKLSLVYIDRQLQMNSIYYLSKQPATGLFRLPPELREMIWHFAIPARKAIHVRARYAGER